MSSPKPLHRDTIVDRLKELPDWRYVDGALRTAYKCNSSRVATSLFVAVAAAAEDANHHPDVDWRYDMLFVALSSHDAGGVTDRDLNLAATISEKAKAAEAKVRLELVRTMDICIDTNDPEPIAELWREALGYVRDKSGALVDPHGRCPAVWFQVTPTPNTSRLHMDINMPVSHAADKLEQAEKLGGALGHVGTPSWTVVTDAQGNRFCFCTEAPHDQ